MIVIRLSVCPPKVKGFLTNWLLEIDTGVYVGNVSARVRDDVWKIITENIGAGKAIMVYSTNTEQGLNFYTFNSEFVPVDYEGILLVRKPPHKSDRTKAAKKEYLTSCLLWN